jgi:hypothetical protein
MADEKLITLAEAIAVIDTYRNIGYKSRALLTILSRADKVIAQEAKRVVDEQTGGLCTKCWGDGFHRPRPSILSGACEECEGTGKRTVALTQC